jgi:hypothetical protein
MAAIGELNPTLLDIAKRSGMDGKIQVIVELLAQTNEILEDMTFKEANNGTGEKTTVRKGLPTATWRKLNYGVPNSKSVTAQVQDSCGMLESYAEIDKALADLNGNTAEYRLSEDRAFLEAMNQTMAATLFYGDTAVNPERFVGLAPRFASLSSDSAQSGYQIINGGGSGSTNTSIWLVTWGMNTAYGIYPKGSMAGFQHKDLGEQTLKDADGGQYQGYRTHYKWDCGLTVRDWRFISRIANIDVTTLVNDASSGAELIDLLIQAVEKLHAPGMGRTVIYCNRTIRSFLRRQIANKTNVLLSMDEVAGKKVLNFAGFPVRLCDQILSTESTVS